MKNIIYICLFFAPTLLWAQQSTWHIEGELTGNLLSKTFKEVSIAENAPAKPPLPICIDIGFAVYKKIAPNLYVGIGAGYQLNRNCAYFIVTPHYDNGGIDPYAVGYYRNWNYINVPLIVQYNLSKRWATQVKFSNAFSAGRIDRMLFRGGWSFVGDTKFEQDLSTSSSERFHTVGAAVSYAIPLKNKNNFVIKGFYDYVFLGASVSNSTDVSVVPNQVGIGVAYQLTNVFDKKTERK